MGRNGKIVLIDERNGDFHPNLLPACRNGGMVQGIFPIGNDRLPVRIEFGRHIGRIDLNRTLGRPAVFLVIPISEGDEQLRLIILPHLSRERTGLVNMVDRAAMVLDPAFERIGPVCERTPEIDLAAGRTHQAGEITGEEVARRKLDHRPLGNEFGGTLARDLGRLVRLGDDIAHIGGTGDAHHLAAVAGTPPGTLLGQERGRRIVPLIEGTRRSYILETAVWDLHLIFGRKGFGLGLLLARIGQVLVSRQGLEGIHHRLKTAAVHHQTVRFFPLRFAHKTITDAVALSRQAAGIDPGLS